MYSTLIHKQFSEDATAPFLPKMPSLATGEYGQFLNTYALRERLKKGGIIRIPERFKNVSLTVIDDFLVERKKFGQELPEAEFIWEK